VRKVEVEIDETRSVLRIARIARRAVVYDTVSVVVGARDDIAGLPGIERKSGAEGKESGEMS
jgi:hypothetical protein